MRAWGARSRRAGQARRRAAPRDSRRPRGQGHPPDRSAPVRREDHRPPRLACSPRRPADSQGQAGSADRVRPRLSARRGDREHPPRRARADRAVCVRYRLSERGRPVASNSRRAGRAGDPPARARPRRRLRAQLGGRAPLPDVQAAFIAGLRARGEGAPTAAWRATASAARAASATSSAATASAAAASKVTRALELGSPGASSPTTSTPWPSARADTVAPARDHPPGHPPARAERPRFQPSAAVLIAGRLSGGSS